MLPKLAKRFYLSFSEFCYMLTEKNLMAVQNGHMPCSSSKNKPFSLDCGLSGNAQFVSLIGLEEVTFMYDI